MITRKSLADEIDTYDQSIADLNAGKKDCFDAYRDQLIAAGVAKENVRKEIEAVKAAIRRRRAVAKDASAVDEKDALTDEIYHEITGPSCAPRARVEIIEEFPSGNLSYSQSGLSYAGEKGRGEPDAKLIATVATGMQTEVGRKALVTALDIMIEREESELTDNQEQIGGNGTDLPVEASTDKRAAGTSRPTISHSPDDLLPVEADTAGGVAPPAPPATLSDPYDPGPIPAFLDRRQPKAREWEEA